LIQVKLREIGLALGFAEAQLPKPLAAPSAPKK
jgi:hypothetical protein